MTSRKVASNLTSVMAEVEADITSKLASASASLGLITDGRQQVLGICLRGVLWAWPRGVAKQPLPVGMLVSKAGNRFLVVPQTVQVSGLLSVNFTIIAFQCVLSNIL